MTNKHHDYDPKTADPKVQEIIAALTASHRQHGTTADAEQEAIARRRLRFIIVGGKPLPAAYIDSALASARKAADLKEPSNKEIGKPS